MNETALAIVKILGTRIAVLFVAMLVSLIGVYHYLVDRTLAPIAVQMSDLTVTTSERFNGIEMALRQQGELLGRIEERLGFATSSFDTLSATLEDDVKVQLAYFAEEQREITRRLYEIERSIADTEDKIRFIRPLIPNPYQYAFNESDLSKWTVTTLASIPNVSPPRVIVTPAELLGLGDFDLESFLFANRLKCDVDRLTDERKARLKRVGDLLVGLREIELSNTGRVDIVQLTARLGELLSYSELGISANQCFENSLVDSYVVFWNPDINSISLSSTVSYHFERVMRRFAFIRDRERAPALVGSERYVGDPDNYIQLNASSRRAAPDGLVPLREGRKLRVEGTLADTSFANLDQLRARLPDFGQLAAYAEAAFFGTEIPNSLRQVLPNGGGLAGALSQFRLRDLDVINVYTKDIQLSGVSYDGLFLLDSRSQEILSISFESNSHVVNIARDGSARIQYIVTLNGSTEDSAPRNIRLQNGCIAQISFSGTLEDYAIRAVC